MKKMFLHKVQFGLPTAEYLIVFLSVLCKKKDAFQSKKYFSIVVYNMKSLAYIICLFLVTACNAQSTSSTTTKKIQEVNTEMKFNVLTDAEKRVILNKGTEYPGTSEFTDSEANGTYICKQCNQPLYTSETKFNSHCGWPSFDDEIDDAVTRVRDADGRRTEIVCSNCQGHLGHVFEGEMMTTKNTRHCVNGISMNFVEGGQDLPATLKDEPMDMTNMDTATFGAGCFWCVEVLFEKLKGVHHVESGYAGGKLKDPTYQMVSQGTTGSVEVDIFFHVHDPTTLNRQGADRGTQYRSVVFYHNNEQKATATEVMQRIDASDLWSDPLVTAIESYYNYSTAEQYHQDYYNLNKETNGYCNVVIGPKVAKFQLKYKNLIKE
jgi:peptide methionine sulfoxide reductase msrA/msrB